MKKLILILAAIAATAAAVFFFVQNIPSAHALNASSPAVVCQPNGTFASLPAQILNADDIQRSVQAMQWLKGQEKTTTKVVGDASIQFSQPYDSAYNGPVAGSFTLGSSTYPVTSDASIEISSPQTIPDNYSGVVQGKVLTTPTAWRWIIQVYKEQNGIYTQVPKQALANETTGEFTIDLSDVANPPAGKWAFGILDANAGYAEYGGKWPSQQFYQGLEVQLKLVTDGIYDWATTKALADNSYEFSGSNTGVKLVRLVDSASGDILAEYVPLTGLIRSYQLDPGDPLEGGGFAEQAFVYDQAIALLAALSANDEVFAERLVDGMLLMQETTGEHAGAFVFASPQLTPAYRNALIRTGAHAIATDALLAFIEKYPQSAKAALYEDRAEQALGFVDQTLSLTGTTQGLYRGGYGDYSGAGNSFVASTVIPWASTEHNIDIWHMYTRAAVVLGGDSQSKAEALKSVMITKLLDVQQKHYIQGMTASGPDTADPLDVNSWGAIQLNATGQSEKADSSLTALSPFKVTRGGITGYAPFYDSPGYPGATQTVWYEGSYGVLMALARTGKWSDYRTLLDSLKVGQESDGSFRYATDKDPIYEISDYKSVAGTAWYILGTTGIDEFWNRCGYVPPADEGEEPTNPGNPSNPGVGAPSGGKTQPASGAVKPGTTTPVVDSEEPQSDDSSPISEDDKTIHRPETSNNNASTETPSSEEKPAIAPWVWWTGGGVAGIGGLWAIIAAIRRKQ